MTLDKAIEKLTPLTKDADWIIAPELKDALKLGIEAMKRVKGERTGYELYAPDLLPGETEE